MSPYFTPEEREALILAYAARPTHCRHYSYEPSSDGTLVGNDGGPTCAVGIDLSAPGASKCCWSEPEGACPKREEETGAERLAFAEKIISSRERAAKIMPLLGR